MGKILKLNSHVLVQEIGKQEAYLKEDILAVVLDIKTLFEFFLLIRYGSIVQQILQHIVFPNRLRTGFALPIVLSTKLPIAKRKGEILFFFCVHENHLLCNFPSVQ